MTYRKITVDKVEYKYTIGKTHTKITGVGLFLNTDIQTLEKYDPLTKEKFYSVTPKKIKELIERHELYYGSKA